MSFTHLHVHTEYSLLDGSNKIKEYVSRLKELGFESGAITDHGVMYGCIDFYKEAKKQGIKPILGCEVYVAPDSRLKKETDRAEERYYHLILLAENNEGYGNLMKIVSVGFVEGYYYKPRVDIEVLRQYHGGLIALSACLAGEVPKNILKNDFERAKETALLYRDIFGEDNYFLELQDHGIPEQKMVNAALLRISNETGIPLAATNDVHYTYDTDVDSHDVLLCIQTGKKLSDKDRMRYEGGQYYLKSKSEMEELFPYAPKALENTGIIADRCNVDIEFGVTKLPKFQVPDGYTSWEYLQKLCLEGLNKKYSPVTADLKNRLEYELSTILKMGYVDYFLIVWDFIKFARDNNIMVGPGRGSAAGSLVSYTLDITQLDPIKYQLLFERFLNPERVSMPDIDVDFCYERRPEVIDYVVKKYGKDRVVQIVTFGTLAARGVIRDVGRVLDMPYPQVDKIAKMIPEELGITIEKALAMNPQLKELTERDSQVEKLIRMARRLEGLPRHTSMHAAGVVISQKSVDEYVPLARATDGTIVTQYTMTTLEELGLLKMDFLGLRTLTVIQKACGLIRDNTGISLDMMNIDYDDKGVYEMISKGQCEGVFQLESAGMKSFMKELQPKNIEDIIAGIALYRPGPMDFIPNYIKGKNNPEEIQYAHPLLEPILSSTYGCIVYQEQVMQIVRDLGGYTLGRSDLLRRAMSKKKGDVMEKERANFVYGNEEENVPGCIRNGVPEDVANKIYDSMIDFAKYAFNKSHAAAYALVSFQTAYLKCYYPIEFMAALMTSVIDNTTKVSGYILNLKQMGIPLLPPDINKSFSGFTVEKDKIRFALCGIKGIGRAVVDAICRERQERGDYRDLNDFCKRLSGKEVNKRTLENFIKAGVFDSTGNNRHQLLMVYQQIIDKSLEEKKNALSGQMSLMDIMSKEDRAGFEYEIPNIEEFPKEDLLRFEKEVIGIYVSGHPLEEYEDYLMKKVTATTGDFILDDETGSCKVSDRQRVTMGGLVASVTTKFTKNNQEMAFITLEDLVGSIEAIVFPKDFEKYAQYLTTEAKIIAEGTAQVEDEKDAKLIVSAIKPLGEEKCLWLCVEDMEAYRQQENKIHDFLGENRGSDDVVIYIKKEKKMRRLSGRFNCNANEEKLKEMKEYLGEGNVLIKSVTG